VATFAQTLEAALHEADAAPSPSAPFAGAVRAFGESVSAAAFVAPATDEAVRAPDGDRDLELGVDQPRTMAEARRAFRKMALRTHPDCPGGSHEAFLRTQALFEEACASLARPVPQAATPVVTNVRWAASPRATRTVDAPWSAFA
jgi:hypothetical protein